MGIKPALGMVCKPLILKPSIRGFLFHCYSCRKYSTSVPNKQEPDAPAKSSQTKPWNEAASVIIAAPMNNSKPYSIGYLMVERNRTGRVMPGTWVFPGGNADPKDSDIKWLELFKNANVDITNEHFVYDTAHVPEIYEENDESLIPKPVKLRITAIREAFEEAGVFLCRPRDKSISLTYYEFDKLQDKTYLQLWQKRVRKDALEFIELCKELKCVPNIHAVNDWSNWLTPTTFKAKSRFDTMSYMVLLPKMCPVVIDGNEAVSAQWISPDRAISDHSKGVLKLMPPQLYEFTRIRRLKTLEDIQSCINARRKLGIERFFPVIRSTPDDSKIFLLPGDDLYPECPDLIGSDKIPVKTLSQRELSKPTRNLHRGTMSSEGIMQSYEINVTRFGHIY